MQRMITYLQDYLNGKIGSKPKITTIQEKIEYYSGTTTIIFFTLYNKHNIVMFINIFTLIITIIGQFIIKHYNFSRKTNYNKKVPGNNEEDGYHHHIQHAQSPIPQRSSKQHKYQRHNRNRRQGNEDDENGDERENGENQQMIRSRLDPH